MADFVSANRYLTKTEMKLNASYVFNFLSARGWSINAICGMLGNMQTESNINPGIWENLDPSDVTRGFGLVQWTPSTKYTSWCAERGLDPTHMDSALLRIEYELGNGIQYYATDEYPLSFAEFKVSTAHPSYLAMAFLHNYERPADLNQPKRGTQAYEWYEYLTGGEVPTPPPVQSKRKSLPLYMMYMATKR